VDNKALWAQFFCEMQGPGFLLKAMIGDAGGAPRAMS
jgi:hypothetical protein